MTIDKIANFLNGVGFRIERTLRPREEFVPGVSFEGMTLYIDGNRLKHPGDILHDAGHIAIVPSLFREKVYGGDIDDSLREISDKYFETHFIIKDHTTMEEDPICRALLQCGEMEAQAWSYAAAIACDIDPALVFHPDGYENESESTLLRMKMSAHLGVHGLQASKMTTKQLFPTMNRWVQI